MVEALCKGDATVVQEFTRPPDQASMAVDAGWMESCYTADTMEGIVAALAAEPGEAAQAAAREIAGKSPSSLKVTLTQELVLAVGCLRSHDFVEGVRAAVIDKDRLPRWSPSRLEDVTPAAVQDYFAASLA